jgi:hypothetical protein
VDQNKDQTWHQWCFITANAWLKKKELGKFFTLNEGVRNGSAKAKSDIALGYKLMTAEEKNAAVAYLAKWESIAKLVSANTAIYYSKNEKLHRNFTLSSEYALQEALVESGIVDP